MNHFAYIREKVIAILAALSDAGTIPDSLDTSRVTVEPPRDSDHGDVATNAAMVLAKQTGLNRTVQSA